ncbi:GNAT family N-acetyltransferase [Parabacteroides sp. PF5-6]|uniref:GNAT family N-acetyltransferase n=1 Tax=Parabacteroides sp. PF5-6 TaxID=1742403 RepID=UPI00240629A0|nr:GNAT family N-acetyltransferase [Parabacteroides sp. PF5-6]MDF9830881.1 catechol 2,3-dioxygenase-like lactoylglutathione lyase family enzyme/GNAT superfamily N-acetyltransferase [Parabacteroides sp. PF5-6]
MKLTHIALWTNDLERLREFYVTWFGGRSNEKYINPTKGFASYFVSFPGGASLEIMQREDITQKGNKETLGLTHIAFQMDSREQVNELVARFRQAGYTVAGAPRFTGDGFYEGSILDPDGNLVELVSFPDVEISRALFYPYDLLLLADPEKEKVDAYLQESECFVAASKEAIVGVVVVKLLSETSAEIMNIAVSEAFQRRGIARTLLRYIADKWAPAHQVSTLVIRTGTSAPGPFMLYQQEGYDLTEVDYNYFVRHYKEPIIEDGVPCKHQLILEKKLS